VQHEHSEHVAAAPDRLYAVLADVENLAHYVPQLTGAQRRDGDTVEVEARYEGHTQHGEAWFRPDEGRRRVEWGAVGGSYHGWLQVDPDGDGSRLTLHLETVHTDDVDRDVAGTLDAIRRLLEAEV
jgi:carbon monoxide dehydrogenase subunit G